MFYLYVNGELVSCSESFSEIYDIIFFDIFDDSRYIVENAKNLHMFIDQLFSKHHCLFTILDQEDKDLKMLVEVWYG